MDRVPVALRQRRLARRRALLLGVSAIGGVTFASRFVVPESGPFLEIGFWGFLIGFAALGVVVFAGTYLAFGPTTNDVNPPIPPSLMAYHPSHTVPVVGPGWLATRHGNAWRCVWLNRLDGVSTYVSEARSHLFVYDEYGNRVEIRPESIGVVVVPLLQAVTAARACGRLGPLPRGVRHLLGVDRDGQRLAGSAASAPSPRATAAGAPAESPSRVASRPTSPAGAPRRLGRPPSRKRSSPEDR